MSVGGKKVRMGISRVPLILTVVFVAVGCKLGWFVIIQRLTGRFLFLVCLGDGPQQLGGRCSNCITSNCECLYTATAKVRDVMIGPRVMPLF